MRKILTYLMFIIFGILIGTSITILLYIKPFSKTEIMVSKEEIELFNEIKIPKNTKLIVDKWMPEGFVTCKLYINIEPPTFEKFNKEMDDRKNLIIPYTVKY